MITTNYSISVNLYWRKTYIFVIKIKSLSYIYTVLVEGDNMNEPVADEIRSILDEHIVLSRQLAAAGHFPVIDVNAIVSRVMDNIVSKAHRLHARRLRELRALFQDVQLLIRVGEYQPGQDKDTDEAIKKINELINFFGKVTMS
ncbi:putative ATP synthase YscN [Arsenophonus endosymbiont of Bemisia tabaci Q2]|nr:putative ATP synthase YscN [Arsenophonus endosymbiont of Bemisia tabaci Q2]